MDPVSQSHKSDFLWYYVTFAGSLLLRLSLFDYVSGDYTAFLGPWYEVFAQHGFLGGFQRFTVDFTNYSPLYLLLLCISTWLPLPKLFAIKLLTILTDYLVAWYVWRLVKREWPDCRRHWAALTLFLFLPTVVMNGALWGQCDVMFTGGLVASLFYLLAGRPTAALIAFGLSYSLKPQAIFWCPLLAGLLLSRRLPWKKVWIPVAVYGVTTLPAVFAGWPWPKILCYWGKADYLPGLTLGAANWYQWVFEKNPEIFRWTGIVLALLFTAYLALWMMEGPPRHLSESQWLVSLTLLSVIAVPFLLPSMHERYFFAADVISIFYAFYIAQGWRVLLLVQLASAFAYLPYLFGQTPIPIWLLSFLNLTALALIVRDLIQSKILTEANKGNEGDEVGVKALKR